jgi:hypothetical protein
MRIAQTGMKPECELLRIAFQSIPYRSGVRRGHSESFWSAPWVGTTVTVIHGTFAPVETRTRRMCSCLYSCMYSCVVTGHRSGLNAHMD